MKKIEEKKARRTRRKRHIRRKISGTPECPRMTVFKSNKNIYVQVIDDTVGSTVASASTIEAETRDKLKRNVDGGAKLGELIGQRLKEKKIDAVVFDRNGYRYHGVIKAVAEGARKAGLTF